MPFGEAPIWVRGCWVGIELRCHRLLQMNPEFGTLSREQQPSRYSCIVLQQEALVALALKHPKAAQWWVNHGYPQESHALFAFGEDECEFMDNSVRRPRVTELTDEMQGAIDR